MEGWLDLRYDIRPLREGDVPMLRGWLAQPHVARWYDGGAPDDAELRDARVRRWIAALDGRPFAYLQDYDVHGWASHHFAFLPAGSRGIDMYIGAPDMIGRGLGPALLRQHAEALANTGAPALGIDPHPDNSAAIRAYGKAGFVIAGGPMETEWGRVVLMTRLA